VTSYDAWRTACPEWEYPSECEWEDGEYAGADEAYDREWEES
jgi:hypothetical protein